MDQKVDSGIYTQAELVSVTRRCKHGSHEEVLFCVCCSLSVIKARKISFRARDDFALVYAKMHFDSSSATLDQ